MVGHVIIHRRPDALLNLREPKLRSTAARNWRLLGKRMATIGFLTTVQRQDWMTAEDALAKRRRTLMEDNPSSG
jgi:hypothetical protein